MSSTKTVSRSRKKWNERRGEMTRHERWQREWKGSMSKKRRRLRGNGTG
jgi:hypothetical protein